MSYLRVHFSFLFLCGAVDSRICITATMAVNERDMAPQCRIRPFTIQILTVESRLTALHSVLRLHYR